MRKGLSISSIVGFAVAALFAATSFAGGMPISITYAGSGFTTGTVSGPGHLPVDMTFATGKGTFGASRLEISTDFMPLEVNDCPSGFDMKLALSYSATVLTFPDQSQLFGAAYSGWLCADTTTTFAYFGEVYGYYIGGTGRFEGATGSFTSPFEGVHVEPTIGFRSIKGSIDGTLELP